MTDFRESIQTSGYELTRSLFTNSIIEIFLAKRIEDGGQVIIKKLLTPKKQLFGISKIEHEFEILSQLKHCGIPKVHEVLRQDNILALVGEYIEGKTLKELIFKEKLNATKTLEIAIELSEILQHVHQKGVIHKNINPGNVMLSSEGRVKLIDFAISSNLNSKTTEMLPVDQIEGTLSYISPEQTGRTAFSVTRATDFYSFGIVLYELLAGKPPFDSVDPLEVVHFHLSRNPTALNIVVPNLPDGLEEIIAKLMQKNPDDRYHSASGLRKDLDTVLEHHLSEKPLIDFKVGSRDTFRVYKQNQKLYGRDTDIKHLLNYYENIDEHRSMLVLVSGYSGVGKSAMIRHVKFPIIQGHGRFVSGKFDQFKKDIPYYAFIEAIQDFIKNLLSESEDKVTAWRQRIIKALGENAGLITEVIPQLSKIIGEQKAVPKLQPAEQEARFNMVLLDFIYVFSSARNTLVIFLDDLQWADLASLNLVKRIIQNPRQENILILGAYRNNEVEKGHPLVITLNQLREYTNQIKTLHLKSLNAETTCKITADSFAMNPEQAKEIGLKVYAKTKGNPFFTHSFLKALFDKKLLRTNDQDEWIWTDAEIDELGYADNVVDLMTERLTTLPQETQDILKYAAVLGNTFNLKDLHSISSQSPTLVYHNLKPAIKEGYLISNEKRLPTQTQTAVETDSEPENVPATTSVFFTFGHDKVQQAAYGLITPSEDAAVHLNIGRLLLQNRSESQLQEGIFELLNLFLKGIHLIEAKEEKVRIAQLCLIAGRKAKDSISYNLGVRFLEMGRQLLDSNSWATNYELTYNTLLALAECEYLDDNPSEAEQYFEVILGNAKTKFDKLKVYYLHSSLYLRIGNTVKSLQLGLDAMKLYNLHFPKTKNAIQATTLLTLGKYLFLFSTKYKDPENLLHVKDCTDEEIIAVNKFLIDLATSAYQQDKNLMMLVCFEIIKSYLRNGFTDASGWGFSGFSVVVLSSLKFQKRGFKLWDLTIELHKKTHSPLIKWRLSYTVLCFRDPWRLPYSARYDQMLETIKACVLNGDQIFTSYTVALYLRTRVIAGENLNTIIESSSDHIDLIKNSTGGIDFLQGFYQLAKALTGQTKSDSWNDASYNGEETLIKLTQEGNHTKIAYYHVAKTSLLYFHQRYEEALDQGEHAMDYIDNLIGDASVAWHALFTCLSISANYEKFNTREKKRNLQKFKKLIKSMKLWAKGCPENFEQQYWLLLAEFSVLKNKFEKARHYYDSAIKWASQNQVTYIEAIANENAALLCERIQLSQPAQRYAKHSWEAYERWGAVIKCRQLESAYPQLLGNKAIAATDLRTGQLYDTSFSSKTALDLASLLKASESIASQVKYKDLLKTLMHVIIENAGAEKGSFLLFKEDQLYVEAEGVSGNKGITILPSIPVKEYEQLPRSFINYCWRSQESVVLDDALKESQFNTDPYIKEHKMLSIMCLPITALGKINGLLYLENGMLKGVFDKNRITLLQMLSGQIGISIENALLYENLEEKVRERTQKIERTLNELKTTQAQLIQSEKMASLGELTAGIAHEIQNPLNFVNNFSDVSGELLEEMEQEIAQGNYAGAKEIALDIKQNLEKINHHGKRADAIVKGMLQHSRKSTAEKEPTDINQLADEYLRLAYHGLRAKDKSFNATLETDFDESIGKIAIVPQDMGRVILNLITNAFYAVNEKSSMAMVSDAQKYKPTVSVSTNQNAALAGKGETVSILVKDNGNGIPKKVLNKIFQPFFTTKPTGKGTGLGLSLSYDIVKAHNGELKVESKENGGTVFTIILPK